MKILIATSAAIPTGGGIASYNQELVILMKSNNQFYLLTDLNEKNVEGYVEIHSNYGKNIFSFQYAKDLLNKIEDWGVDLIINSNSAIMAVLAPYINIPIISISHFVDGKLALNAGYNAKYVNRIISLSHYGKIKLHNRFKIKDYKKIEVVYNFVANKELPHPKYKYNQQPITIVYPGGTSIKKSVDVVMSTLYKLLKTDLKFKFIWLGNTILPGSSISKHKYLTQFFEKDDRLEIIGLVSREISIKYIERSNIFLLPSRGEGCPMTLLEAMRAGCIPIVSDAKHGSREILENGNFGVIAKQGNSEQLYQILTNIIKNHNSFQESYLLSYNYSKQKLSQEKWKVQMTNIITDALKSIVKKKKINIVDYFVNVNRYKYSNYMERIKEILDSFRCRIIFECLYYKYYK